MGEEHQLLKYCLSAKAIFEQWTPKHPLKVVTIKMAVAAVGIAVVEVSLYHQHLPSYHVQQSSQHQDPPLEGWLTEKWTFHQNYQLVQSMLLHQNLTTHTCLLVNLQMELRKCHCILKMLDCKYCVNLIVWHTYASPKFWLGGGGGEWIWGSK